MGRCGAGAGTGDVAPRGRGVHSRAGALPLNPYLVAALGTGLAAEVARRAAGRLGALDAPGQGDSERKLQDRPVPTIGGFAVAVGLGLGLIFAGDSAGGREVLWCRPWAFWASAGAALALGAWDDRRPLRAGSKFLAQALAGLPLAAEAWMQADTSASAWTCAILVLVGFLTAVNAANTFDNADGALGGVGALGFAFCWPLAACALAAFLPFNLARPHRAGVGVAAATSRRTRVAPFAYLGDAGSHLVGALCVCVPGAWPLLWIPLIDIAFVVRDRVRAGQRPWVGDRRHLAHRLERLPWGSVRVAVALAIASLPAWLAALALQSGAGPASPSAKNLAATGLCALCSYGVLRWIAARPRSVA